MGSRATLAQILGPAADAGRVTDAMGNKLAHSDLVKSRKRELAAPVVERKSNVVPQNYVSRCELTLPVNVPGLNQLMRQKIKTRMQLEAELRPVVFASWQRQGSPRLAGAYTTSWLFIYSDRSLDPSNRYCGGTKVLLDCLKNAGCIVNDSDKYHKPPAVYDWKFSAIMDCVRITLATAAGEEF